MTFRSRRKLHTGRENEALPSRNLDSCNGTAMNGEYIYVLTETFPYVPRCLNGRPDSSFSRRR